MSFLSKFTLTHWRCCQSASWFSWKKLVISPSRLISYLRSTFVTGQAFTTSAFSVCCAAMRGSELSSRMLTIWSLSLVTTQRTKGMTPML